MTTARINVDNRTFVVKTGSTVMESLVKEGLLLRTDCGSHGRCGKCLVRVAGPGHGGLSEMDEAEGRCIGPAERVRGYRLACRARVLGPVSLEIPDESRLARQVVQKGLPTLLSRLNSHDPAASRSAEDTWGMAVDIGTTTIAAYLCDLSRGMIRASTSVRNPQCIFGDDVISRINAVRIDPEVLPRLQAMVAGALDWAVLSLSMQANIEPEKITRVVCVGNSIMLHLFLGIDPSSIGVYPYTPKFLESKDIGADTTGLRSCPYARLRTLPLISGYLGADIVSAAIAADLPRALPGTMLVDVGTNGEVFLVTESGFSATSCATGPAFEGAAIRHGMQATAGAIDTVKFLPRKGRLEYTVIPGIDGRPTRPAGICGSGVISAAAELLQAGILRKDGSFNPRCSSPLLRPGEKDILEFVLASGTDHEIVLTQADVRALQLAKGALRAGIDLLCRENSLSRPFKILMAGAFGSFIDRADALRIGMFPEMDICDIEVVGNAAGAGAVFALLREELFEEAAEVARSTRVLDLASHKGFQKAFVDALSF